VEARLRESHIPYTMHVTAAPGDGVELARKVARGGAKRLLAVGGDGTVHEIVNGLLSSGVASGRLPHMAVLPLGTGNDFYRMVGAPRTLDGAMDMLQWGVARPFDVGEARWPGGSRHFVNLLGVGVDVEVLRRREGFRRLGGLPQYLAALLAAVVRFRPIPVRVRLESGEVVEGPVTLAAITVGPSAGGGFLLNPGATPDDGLLDLCFVDGLSLPQVFRYIPRVIRGTHGSLPVVRLRRFAEARVESMDGEPLHFQLDGELMPEPVRWLEVGIRSAAIRVLVPGQGA